MGSKVGFRMEESEFTDAEQECFDVEPEIKDKNDLALPKDANQAVEVFAQNDSGKPKEESKIKIGATVNNKNTSQKCRDQLWEVKVVSCTNGGSPNPYADSAALARPTVGDAEKNTVQACNCEKCSKGKDQRVEAGDLEIPTCTIERANGMKETLYAEQPG